MVGGGGLAMRRARVLRVPCSAATMSYLAQTQQVGDKINSVLCGSGYGVRNCE